MGTTTNSRISFVQASAMPPSGSRNQRGCTTRNAQERIPEGTVDSRDPLRTSSSDMRLIRHEHERSSSILRPQRQQEAVHDIVECPSIDFGPRANGTQARTTAIGGSRAESPPMTPRSAHFSTSTCTTTSGDDYSYISSSVPVAHQDARLDRRDSNTNPSLWNSRRVSHKSGRMEEELCAAVADAVARPCSPCDPEITRPEGWL